jgi:hypothetical protein
MNALYLLAASGGKLGSAGAARATATFALISTEWPLHAAKLRAMPSRKTRSR